MDMDHACAYAAMPMPMSMTLLAPLPLPLPLRTPHTKRRLPLARQGRVMENPSTFPSHQSISRSKAGHPSTFPAGAAKAHTAPPAHRCRSNGMLLLSHCSAPLCPCERLAFWYLVNGHCTGLLDCACMHADDPSSKQRVS